MFEGIAPSLFAEANDLQYAIPGGLIGVGTTIDPALCTKGSKHQVEIECEGTFTRGMTVVDELNVTIHDTANVEMWKPITADKSPHITVCWEIDVPGWKALLERCVRAQV